MEMESAFMECMMHVPNNAEWQYTRRSETDSLLLKRE